MGAPASSTIDRHADALPNALRVLVIDSRSERRELMRYVIQLISTPVTVVGFAEDPDGAVAAVERLRPDVALVEIQLPVTRGLATIAALRGCSPTLRIIVCSFHHEALTRQQAADAGADAYLVKPVSPRDLDALLRLPEPGTVAAGSAS